MIKIAKLSEKLHNLSIDDVNNQYNINVIAIKQYYSKDNKDYDKIFAFNTENEIREELNKTVNEFDKEISLTLLAAIEAMFKVDFIIRCRIRDKSIVTRKFRELYKVKFDKVSLEEDIIEVWKKYTTELNIAFSELKSLIKYRNWLAHGRYWTLKAGRNNYQYYDIHEIACILRDNLPLFH